MANKSKKSKILDFVQNKGFATRREIQRFAFMNDKARNNFCEHCLNWENYIPLNRWYTGPLNQKTGYLMRPTKREKRYLIYDKNTKLYSVTSI